MMHHVAGNARSLIYFVGMVAGAAMVFVGWWLLAGRQRYTAVACGRYTAADNAEKRFFEKDGREYRYWLSTVEIAFAVSGAEHRFKETFRVYDSAYLPVVGAAREVRFDPANPNAATSRSVLAEDAAPLVPKLLIGLGLIVLVALNIAMIRAHHD